MYTEDGYYGGGIPLRYDQTYYYVKASGNDGNPGTRDLPFKTLAKAVQTARYKTSTTAPWIQTIVVLGTLNDASEQSNNAAGVFVIQNPQAGEYETGLIRITGDPALAGGAPAVLTAAGVSGRRVLAITGDKTTVQLDHITITGGSGWDGGGIRVAGGARLTLTDGADISGNYNTATMGDNGENNDKNGGGVVVDNAKLTMYGGSISNNTMNTGGNNGTGGGVFIANNGEFRLFDGIISGNVAKWVAGVCVYDGVLKMYGGLISGNQISSAQTGYAGGVAVHGPSTAMFGAGAGKFEMTGGNIQGNQQNTGGGSRGGGGGVWVEGEFSMSGGAEISGNSSQTGGGGVIVKSNGKFRLDTREGASITGNTSQNGANVRKESNGFFEWNGSSAAYPLGSSVNINSPLP
jgi:hypothetical protein